MQAAIQWLKYLLITVNPPDCMVLLEHHLQKSKHILATSCGSHIYVYCMGDWPNRAIYLSSGEESSGRVLLRYGARKTSLSHYLPQSKYIGLY